MLTASSFFKLKRQPCFFFVKFAIFNKREAHINISIIYDSLRQHNALKVHGWVH